MSKQMPFPAAQQQQVALPIIPFFGILINPMAIAAIDPRSFDLNGNVYISLISGEVISIDGPEAAKLNHFCLAAFGAARIQS